jgi:CarD family transcriptional regulator
MMRHLHLIFKTIMPAKKTKKAAAKALKTAKTKKSPAKKIAKKSPVKKPPVKKLVGKAKKIIAKKVKKAVVKKPVKKIPAKKIAPKSIKKPVKKPVKSKVEIKKPALKKKIEAPKIAPIKNKKDSTSLAKKIMSAGQKSSALTPIAKPAEKKNEAPQKTIPQKAIIVKKSDSAIKPAFKIGDHAIYPSHGIGKIVDIKKTKILGKDFSCYLMYFEKEKLTIKIPMDSAEKIGLRHLISKAQMDEVFVILRSGVKKLKGMWSRRAQEYETKINSGDIMLLAEVLRDLTRDIEDGERSYSERIIYETAVNRLGGEYAAIYGISFDEAKEKIITTAKDKLNAEGKITQKDEFDEFDAEGQESDLDEDEESEDDEDEEDEDEDEDDDYDDDEDEDEAPRKKKKKK